MFFKKIWAKSGAIATLKSLGIPDDHSIIIVDFFPALLMNKLIYNNKKLNNQQKNILMALSYLIYYNGKTNNSNYEYILEDLSQGFRFQIYKYFNNKNIRISFSTCIYLTRRYIDEETLIITEFQQKIIEDMVNIFNLQELKLEFEK
jgi:hypothetical protein